MFRGKKAFTLTELLIALAIVGALAALAIPSLVEDINRKLLISQLKNTVVMVQDLIDRQLVDNKTQSLENTAFSNATTLMSSSNFAIADECTEAKKCWGNENKYKRLSDMDTKAGGGGTTKMLKNGITLGYSVDNWEATIDDGTKSGDL